jgi:hypothetical protein
LRRELELEFASQILALELLVLTNITRNHLAHLAGRQQQADGDLESFFFEKVDENNRQRFGLTEAEKTLKTVRIEAQPDAVA